MREHSGWGSLCRWLGTMGMGSFVDVHRDRKPSLFQLSRYRAESPSHTQPWPCPLTSILGRLAASCGALLDKLSAELTVSVNRRIRCSIKIMLAQLSAEIIPSNGTFKVKVTSGSLARNWRRQELRLMHVSARFEDHEDLRDCKCMLGPISFEGLRVISTGFGQCVVKK